MLFRWAPWRRVRIPVQGTFPTDRAADGCECLAVATKLGKIVLTGHRERPLAG